MNIPRHANFEDVIEEKILKFERTCLYNMCSGSTKILTYIKTHHNGIRIITWHNDHRNNGRAQMPPIPKHAPKVKDNPGVICGWSSTHGGPYYTVNHNILLYKHLYINPCVWNICASNFTLFITSFKY
jgi:hypothetical protein